MAYLDKKDLKAWKAAKPSGYNSWQNMKDRCRNPKEKSFPRYGGRGIAVCQRWIESFDNFLADMGPRPSPRHSIDRYPNNNGNYEPNNCRWATPEQQAQNRRNNVTVSFNGKEQCISKWAKELGMPRATLNKRLKNGWRVDEALA